jgi:hypothetical protein
MVRRTLLRSRRQESARYTTPQKDPEAAAKKEEDEFKAKKEKYNKAKKEFEDACIKKHCNPSVMKEAGGALRAGLKGTGKVIDHFVDAAAEMGRMTQRDLYDHMPEGARDRAIIKVMMESKNAATKKPGRGKRNDVIVYVHGKPVIVDKSDVFTPASARRRRY